MLEFVIFVLEKVYTFGRLIHDTALASAAIALRSQSRLPPVCFHLNVNYPAGRHCGYGTRRFKRSFQRRSRNRSSLSTVFATDNWAAVPEAGSRCPVGKVVRYPRPVRGTAVKFSEYACAVAGTLHGLDKIGNPRVCWAEIMGSPRFGEEIGLRVSAARHGVNG